MDSERKLKEIGLDILRRVSMRIGGDHRGDDTSPWERKRGLSSGTYVCNGKYDNKSLKRREQTMVGGKKAILQT